MAVLFYIINFIIQENEMANRLKESFIVSGEEIIKKVKEIIQEGNARKIINKIISL